MIPLSDGHLWDEYKLLQDKIDRIGDFRFRVKAWVVSLAGILGVSSVATNSPWWTTLFAIPLVLMFFPLETYYGYVEKVLVARLRVLEPELQRREFRQLDSKEKQHGRSWVGPRLTENINRALKGHEFVRRVHGIFYLLMVLILAGFALATKFCGLEDQSKQVIVNCPVKDESSGGQPRSVTKQIPLPQAIESEAPKGPSMTDSGLSRPVIAK